MDIIESNKRNAKICYNGFMYTKHASRKSKMWWKCVKRSSGHCQGSMTTDLNRENPSIGLPHNHAPDETQIRLAKVRNWMKTQAINTRDKPAQIFSHGVSQCHDDVRSLIPSEETCKRTLRNQRRSPPVPRLLQDLGALPIEFCQTIGPNPKEFLLYDNGPNNNNRILVFGTHEGLRLLAASDTLHMDGNFAMAPNIFKQIYVIRVPFGNAAVTSVYALLPN